MAAYVIFIREGAVTDHEAMAKYQSGNGSAPPNPHMKIHTLYGPMEQLEGEPCDGVVVLEFPDTATAREWYFSDDYQSRVPFR